MAINPNMVLDFAQGMGQRQPLTQLGGQIGEFVQGRRQQQAMEQANQQYQGALSAYMQNRTPENLMAVYQAAEPLGKFESVQSQLADMNEAQRQRTVDQNVGLLAAIESGDTETASNLMAERVEAMGQSGNERDRRVWSQMQEALQEGDTDRVDTYLRLVTGVTPEGREALENLRAYEQNRREAVSSDADILNTINDMRYMSEEDKRMTIEGMSNLPGPYGDALAEMVDVGRGYQQGSMTLDDVLDREESLRKEYDNYVEPYRTALDSAQSIRDLVESTDASNFTDQMLTVLFSKVPDPNSVVRPSEAQATREAQAATDRLVMLLSNLRGEGEYSEDTKQDILAAVDTVANVYEGARDSQRDRIDYTLQELWGDREDRLQGSRRRVFGDANPDGDSDQEQENPQTSGALQTVQDSDLYGYLTDDEKDSLQGMSEDDIRAEFPELFEEEASATTPNLTTAQQQRFREYLAEANGIPLANVQNVPIDTLITNNPGSWRGFSQREGVKQPDMTLEWAEE